MAAQDGGRALVILDVQGEGGVSARAAEERVAAVDIDLGHQQRGEQLAQLAGAFLEFGDDQVACGTRNFMRCKQIEHGIRVADDDAHDGGIGGVLDVEGQDVDGMLVEHFDDIKERSDFVSQENGELLHARSLGPFGGSGTLRHGGYLYE